MTAPLRPLWTAPIAGYGLPKIRPRLVLGETECRWWAGKLVIAQV